MIAEWSPAPYEKIERAAEELKAIIRAAYPAAQFQLARAADDRDAWNLRTLVEADDLDDVSALTKDREIDMLVEENVPLYVIPTRGRERFARHVAEAVRQTG